MILLRQPAQLLKTSDLVSELQAKHEQKQQQGDNSLLSVFLLIHGLVSEEGCWTFPSDDKDDHKDAVDYGRLLERDIPHSTSLYLRYNTGMSISSNGKLLNELLEALLAVQGLPHLQICLICHSMGGLVARSATQYALRQQSSWIHATRRIIFLGTPHLGSYWECAGNVLTNALDSVRYTRSAANLVKLRSQGIRDLRYGYVPDWDLGDPQQDQEQLLEWVSYHTVIGAVHSNPSHPLNYLLGDGAVSRTSAQGQAFPSTREFPGINHNALLRSWEVYEQLLEWILIENDSNNATTDPLCWDTTNLMLCKDPKELVFKEDKLRTTTNIDSEQFVEDLTDSSRFSQYHGVTALVQHAVYVGATTVEQVQTEITQDVYLAVKSLTPPSAVPVVESIQGIHSGIASAVFFSVRLINYGATETAKCVFKAMDSIDHEQSKEDNPL